MLTVCLQHLFQQELEELRLPFSNGIYVTGAVNYAFKIILSFSEIETSAMWLTT